MKPNTNNALLCSALGHNYAKSKTNIDHSAELTCCNCGTQITTDAFGNFDESSISNKAIVTTLRQLFHLRIQISKPKFSS